MCPVQEGVHHCALLPDPPDPLSNQNLSDRVGKHGREDLDDGLFGTSAPHCPWRLGLPQGEHDMLRCALRIHWACYSAAYGCATPVMLALTTAIANRCTANCTVADYGQHTRWCSLGLAGRGVRAIGGLHPDSGCRVQLGRIAAPPLNNLQGGRIWWSNASGPQSRPVQRYWYRKVHHFCTYHIYVVVLDLSEIQLLDSSLQQKGFVIELLSSSLSN